MLVRLTPPADNQRHALYMEQAFAAIHQANRRRTPLTLLYGYHDGTVGLYARYAQNLAPIVDKQLHAFYPGCAITQVDADAFASPDGFGIYRASLRLTPDVFPLKRYGQLLDELNRVAADPLASILETIPKPHEGPLRGHIELVVRPADARRTARVRRLLRRLNAPFFARHPRLAHRFATLATSHVPVLRLLSRLLGWWLPRENWSRAHDPLTTSATRHHEREDDLQAAADKLGHRHLFEGQLRLTVYAPTGQQSAAHAALHTMAGSVQAFGSSRLARLALSRIRRNPPRIAGDWQLYSTEELASLYHPPTTSVQAEAMELPASRALSPPVDLPVKVDGDELTLLGETKARGHVRRYGLAADHRLRHVVVTGKSGVGKSTLLLQMLRDDIRAGRGVACLDPHGDLAEMLLTLIPRRRTNDVVLLDLADARYPVGFNLLACDDPRDAPLIASAIVTAFKKLAGTAWGWQTEQYIRQAALAVVGIPATTLVSLHRFLIDPHYRTALVPRIENALVRSFWEQVFPAKSARQQAEELSATLNKIGAFISNPLLANVVGQRRTHLRLRHVMDEGQILIVNLAKGRVGEDAARLFGSLLVTQLQLDAMRRGELPPEQRRPFYAYVDEFSTFATESFAASFSEARKFGLGITAALQFLDQCDEPTLGALLGNAGTFCAFQSGQRDAELLASLYGPPLTPHDFQALPPFECYARLYSHPRQPFLLHTLKPRSFGPGRQDPVVVRRTSHHRYARPEADVTAELREALMAA